jgi:hypothetical protein
VWCGVSVALLRTQPVASWCPWHMRSRLRSRWGIVADGSTRARAEGVTGATDRLRRLTWARWMGVRQGAALAL